MSETVHYTEFIRHCRECAAVNRLGGLTVVCADCERIWVRMPGADEGEPMETLTVKRTAPLQARQLMESFTALHPETAQPITGNAGDWLLWDADDPEHTRQVVSKEYFEAHFTIEKPKKKGKRGAKKDAERNDEGAATSS